MFKVTVRGPDGSETSYPLGPDQGLIVGRDEACDVVLPSKRVSRRHARFFTTEGKLFIEDLGSQNGVFVGGARIAGTSEIRPGPPIEIGEFGVRIRREDLNSAENSYAGTLQGFGTTEGSLLQLPPERGVVGRDESADIVIYSDSVSRKHAELRNAGIQGYFVQDLGSANGTYVNGAKLVPKVERPLRPNDQIQFGDTAWLVVPRSAVSNPATEGSRRRFLLGTLLALALLTVGVVYLLQHPNLFGTHDTITKKAAPDQAPAIDRCNQAIADTSWQEAQRACSEAYDEEPFVERRRLLRTAERELRFKDIFEEASSKAKTGAADREALELFLTIDPSSAYFPRARIEVQQLSKGLMRADLNACRDAGRKHSSEKALDTCKTYLRYQCHNGADPEALKILRTAGKAGVAWQCPPELDVWFKNGQGVIVTRDAYCKPKYENKDECDAIMHYVRQEADDAVRSLLKIKHGAVDGVDALKEEIVSVQGNYKSGQTKLSSNDFVGAEKDWNVALDNDQRIMQPSSPESDYAKLMKDSLADHYKKLGDSEQAQGRIENAFDKYVKAAVYRPAMNMFIETLSQVALDRFNQSKSCDTNNVLLHATRETTSVHRDAVSYSTTNHCPSN